MGEPFDTWIDTLTHAVIEDEYGYEPGEFTVYPEHWRRYFRIGLSPKEAFDRTLKAFDDERRAAEAEQVENWARIQAEDAKHRDDAPKDNTRD